MRIEEVMNKYPVTIDKQAPISDVAELLVKYNLTAVSVVDESNKLIGIITEGDLLYKKVRPHVPHYVNVLGVDNGVHLHPGNIVSDDLQRHKALSTFLSV